jgi:hypothetical protein
VGVRGAGAAGCCTQHKRSAAAPHVAPRRHDVMDARRHERRSGRALCALQWGRWCAGGQCAGAAGSCARCARRAAALHVVRRCRDVM